MEVEDTLDQLLQQQVEYYRARAREYDEWFLRQGRYDRGPAARRQWIEEVEDVSAALSAFQPEGEILELASGTGWWTERLLPFAEGITAVDASPEVLALNRQRLQSSKVRYLEADLFHWTPDRQYDTVFFSFWLSHVPPDRFADFWQMVGDALRPGGRFFLIDSLYNESATAVDHCLEADGAVTRRLNDGREYRIIKVFYRPEDLQSRLAALGWKAEIRATKSHFLYGWGSL